MNERIQELTSPGRRYAGVGPVDYVCECDDRGCIASITLERDEFAEIAAMPNRYLVVPGHYGRDMEIVVREREYAVVAVRSRITQRPAGE